MGILESLIEVSLAERGDFLKIRETLERIGIASKRSKKLFQSCHILHKRGRYYILNFKQLFALDGRETNFSEEDQARTNTIAALLDEWGLCEIVSTIDISQRVPMSLLKIIPFKDRDEWELISKYAIGKKR